MQFGSRYLQSEKKVTEREIKQKKRGVGRSGNIASPTHRVPQWSSNYLSDPTRTFISWFGPPMTEQAATDRVLVSVQGVPFQLSRMDMDRLGSQFLSALTSPLCARPEDGVYELSMDPEAFSAALHFARFGHLPDTSVLRRAGDYLGTDAEKVHEEEEREEKRERTRLADKLIRAFDTQSVKDRLERKEHHSTCRDQEGFVHCMNSRVRRRLFRVPKFPVCVRCSRRTLEERTLLGWCHKCMLCMVCQEPGRCPEDRNVWHHCQDGRPGNMNTSAGLLAMRDAVIHAATTQN